MTIKYPYHSLEDFLVAEMHTVDGVVDGVVDDGWGASYPVKGREIEATVLFADITGFSRRTLDLDPTETLIFVNHFFSWITAEALRDRPGIVDKYIGDEIMVVFSEEFGSEDPFVDAVQTARWMSQNDVFAFCPHIGIASGEVIVGYVGTPIKYNCSVFGAPVALAARCAGLSPRTEESYSSSMAFPADEWGSRDFDEVFPPKRYRDPDGTVTEVPHDWRMHPAGSVALKNIGDVKIQHIAHHAMWFSQQSPEERAREVARALAAAGRRWQRPGTGHQSP
jgi:Adenylate and Guanylate cyclase catalytic domain